MFLILYGLCCASLGFLLSVAIGLDQIESGEKYEHIDGDWQ